MTDRQQSEAMSAGSKQALDRERHRGVAVNIALGLGDICPPGLTGWGERRHLIG